MDDVAAAGADAAVDGVDDGVGTEREAHRRRRGDLWARAIKRVRPGSPLELDEDEGDETGTSKAVVGEEWKMVNTALLGKQKLRDDGQE